MSAPVLDMAGNKTIVALGRKIAKLNVFAHDYAGDPTEVGSVVKMPVIGTSAGLFNEDTNGYQQQPGSIEEASINVSAQYVAGYTVTPKQLTEGLDAYSGLWNNLAEDAARAIARSVETAVVGQVKADTAGSVETLAYSKAGFAGLYKTVWDAGLRLDDCVLVLNPTAYSKMLETVNMAVVNLEKAVETGVIENFLGFAQVICSAAVDSGLVGFIAEKGAIGIVSRRIPLNGEAFPLFAEATDADTGLAVTLVGSTNLNSGKNYIATTCLFGTNIVKEDAIIALSANA